MAPGENRSEASNRERATHSKGANAGTSEGCYWSRPATRLAREPRLLVLEAMKMENEITATRAGRVAGVHVSAGTVVEGGLALITLE